MQQSNAFQSSPSGPDDVCLASSAASGYKVFVGGLSVNCKSKELRQYLEKFGEVTQCDVAGEKEGKSKGFAFATFRTQAARDAALGKNHTLKAKTFEVRELVDSTKNSEMLQELSRRKLYLSNLKKNVTESELAGFFGKYGQVEELTINRDVETQESKGFGFVMFAESTSVQAILGVSQSKVLKFAGSDLIVKQAIPKKEIERQKQSAPESDQYQTDDLGTPPGLSECFYPSGSGLGSTYFDPRYVEPDYLTNAGYPAQTASMSRGFDQYYTSYQSPPDQIGRHPVLNNYQMDLSIRARMQGRLPPASLYPHYAGREQLLQPTYQDYPYAPSFYPGAVQTTPQTTLENSQYAAPPGHELQYYQQQGDLIPNSTNQEPWKAHAQFDNILGSELPGSQQSSQGVGISRERETAAPMNPSESDCTAKGFHSHSILQGEIPKSIVQTEPAGSLKSLSGKFETDSVETTQSPDALISNQTSGLQFSHFKPRSQQRDVRSFHQDSDLSSLPLWLQCDNCRDLGAFRNNLSRLNKQLSIFDFLRNKSCACRANLGKSQFISLLASTQNQPQVKFEDALSSPKDKDTRTTSQESKGPSTHQEWDVLRAHRFSFGIHH